MTKRHWRDSIKALGSYFDPEQNEKVKKSKIGIHFFSKQPQSLQYYWRLWDCPIQNKYIRYKALLQVPIQCRHWHRFSWCALPERVSPLLIPPDHDLDYKIAKLMTLIQHNSQSRKSVGGLIFDSELIELVNDFHKKYETLYFYGKKDIDTSSSHLVSFCSGSELVSYSSVQQFEVLKSECDRLSNCFFERERQLCTQKREIEDLSMEAKELEEQNDGLRELILELEMTSKKREEKLSDLLIKLEEKEADLISKSEDLLEKANDLQLEMDALWSEKEIVYQEGEIVHMLSPRKSKSESSFLKINEESSDFSCHLEHLKAKFERKNMVLEKIVEEKKGLERKVKEMENQMENVMFENEGLHIRVSELEESLVGRNCDVFVLKAEFENLKNNSSTQIKALEEEITSLKEELNIKEQHYGNNMIGKEKVTSKLFEEKTDINTNYYKSKSRKSKENTEGIEEKFEKSVETTKVDNENISGLNSVEVKFQECDEQFPNIISMVSEMKNEEIMRLEEKIWKLENDMKGLGEEKREAIRQLCIWVEYHRNQNNYFKKIIYGLHHAVKS